MSVGVYMGIGGVPKELSGVYVGVGGAAKEVQEIYVGVGGVPKLVWQNGISYTADVSTVTSGGRGTVNGKYTLDGTHVVGTATVTGLNGTTDKNIYIPLPKRIVSGDKNFTAKLYDTSGNLVDSYSSAAGNIVNIDKKVDGVNVSTMRITDSSGWNSYKDLKMELTFDYYCMS